MNNEAVSLDGGGGVLGRSREPGPYSFGRLIEGTLAACRPLLAAVWLIILDGSSSRRVGGLR
jgi:hypothetical protein